MAIDGGWRQLCKLVVGDWWLMAVSSGWRWAVSRRWQLAAVGGWRLMVRYGRSLTKKKNLGPKGPPCFAPTNIPVPEGQGQKKKIWSLTGRNGTQKRAHVQLNAEHPQSPPTQALVHRLQRTNGVRQTVRGVLPLLPPLCRKVLAL